MNEYNNIPPGELPFHYDREERLKNAPERVRNNLYGEGKRKKIVFDRRLLIIMIDIVIVVFAFIGISAYQRSLSRVGDFGGLQLEMNAIEYNGEILASVKVKTLVEFEAGTIIEAAFSFEGREPVIVKDLVPSNQGDRRILRARLEPSEEQNTLNVRVILGDKSVILKKRIEKE